MTPAHTKRGSRRYHYYTCTNAQKRGWQACPSRSIPAAEMDKVVLEQIRRACPDAALSGAEAAFERLWRAVPLHERDPALRRLVERVEYDGRAGQLAITFRPGGFEALAE